MKTIILIVSILIALAVEGQSVSINNSGSTPHSSAMLDISSDSKGILLPRMTESQRTAISSPAVGLVVYDTDNNSFWYRNTSAWVELSGELIDSDGDTSVEVEKNIDEDIIRFTAKANETVSIDERGINVNAGESIFIGENAGTNDDGSNNFNTIVGKNAFVTNTAGARNTTLGYSTMNKNSSGNNNVAIGYNSLKNQTIANGNTSVGNDAMFSNLTGSLNVAVGYYSLRSNTSGSSNTALGNNALRFNEMGTSNVAIGESAGKGNINGSKNIFIGYHAGENSSNSDRLFIDNSNSPTPLIYGNFDADSLIINGSLSVKDEYTLPVVDGVANQVMTTDGSGNVAWTPLTQNTSSGDTTRTMNTDLELAKILCDCPHVPPFLTSTLLDKGYTASELYEGGVDAASLYGAGLTLAELVAIPVSVQDLLDVGFTPVQIFAEGGVVEDDFIGLSYGGGIIFNVNSGAVSGAIMANQDLDGLYAWDCNGLSISNTSLLPYTGDANTLEIFNQCGQVFGAAFTAHNLHLNGYDDWHLPSWETFFDMHDIGDLAAANFVPYAKYWTSSQGSGGIDEALAYIFEELPTGHTHKTTLLRVRVVRFF